MDQGGNAYLFRTDGGNITGVLVNISEKDFNRYPQLRELFENIDPDKDEIISTAGIDGRVIYEIKSKYSYGDNFSKTLYWNGDYYSILISTS